MKPWLKSLKKFIHSLWRDENAFRRQVRLLVAMLTTSGLLYADKIEPIFGHKVAQCFRGLCVIVTVGVAIHGDKISDPAVTLVKVNPQ